MERPEEEGDDLGEKCRGHELCLRAVRAADRAICEAVERLQAAVDDARAAGVPWSAIGRVLGVSRQSAHQRFSRKEQGPPDP